MKKVFVFPAGKEKGTFMLKGLGILMGGIFVGAVGAEILHKKCPEALDKLRARTCKITSGIKEAFKAGYANAMQSPSVAEPSV